MAVKKLDEAQDLEDEDILEEDIAEEDYYIE